MSFLDLLLADALATGLARAMAEDRPPPENFFVIPPQLEAWLKIKASCNEENMVIAVEVTDDLHPGCKQVQPMFMNLARKMQEIPFFRVKIAPLRTHNQLREDLGGIESVPTVVVVFFDDDTKRISQVEGAADVMRAIRSGALEAVIRQKIEQRMKLKAAERLMAGALLMGVVGQAAARRRAAQLEYEQKLKAAMEEKQEKEDKGGASGGLLALLEGLNIKESGSGATGGEGGGKGTCDLCDGMFPNPVTYHMKRFHGGCGKSANGMGYDSRGTYKSGWQGNCGDGGSGLSTWYLLCKDCRAKYLRQK